ncbi:MAG TPA: flagellar hook-associated protein FlgL [Polyangiaceae bacterium]|nr:flagellar hook-associated protein FlgL [Polyangiaceae bacterium]
MRVTDGMKYLGVTRNLARLQTQNAQAQQQASTGLRLEKPSDDPVAAAELARLRASLSNSAGHREAIQRAQGDAELAESTLSQVNELMASAKEAAMQGSNDSLGVDDRKALATQVRGLRTELLKLANTRGTKGYIFAGSKTDAAAFDSNGAFRGDDQEQVIDTGGSSPVAVSASGAKAFTAAGGRDVFADLDALATALDNNDRSGASAALDAIDAGATQVTRERTRIGLTASKLQASDGVLEQLGVDLGKQQANVGAVDPFEAYSKVTTLAQSLQQAVQVSRQVLDLGDLWR